MSRVLGGPRGAGVFLWARYPCSDSGRLEKGVDCLAAEIKVVYQDKPLKIRLSNDP